MKLRMSAFSIFSTIFSSMISMGFQSAALAQDQKNALKTSQTEACPVDCACSPQAAKDKLELAKAIAPFTPQLKPYEQLLKTFAIKGGEQGAITLARGQEQIQAKRICVKTNEKTKKSQLIIHYHSTDPAFSTIVGGSREALEAFGLKPKSSELRTAPRLPASFETQEQNQAAGNNPDVAT